MFATTTHVFGTKQVLARVEWHPPDFQNHAEHRGVTLYETTLAAVDVSTASGVDISHYQAAVDFKQVAAANVSFVFMKATESTVLVDAAFAQHWADANKASLALFHNVSGAMSSAEAEHQASELPALTTKRRVG